jgi:hypothetical protein
MCDDRIGTTNKNNSSWIYSLQFTVTSTVIRLLCPHQYSGNGFQRLTFPFLWVSELCPYLSRRNSWLPNSKEVHSPKDSFQSESLYAIQEGSLFINWSSYPINLPVFTFRTNNTETQAMEFFCSLLKIIRRFGVSWHLHFKGWRISQSGIQHAVTSRP